MKKLYGKELDEELVKREKAREERRNNRITLREAAKKAKLSSINNYKKRDYIGWEYGYDVCPHKKYETSVGGIPLPKFLFERCLKCGKVKGLRKITNRNMKEAYRAFKNTGKVEKNKKK